MCKSAEVNKGSYDLRCIWAYCGIKDWRLWCILMHEKTMYLFMHKKCTASRDLCSCSSTNYYSNTRNRYQLHGLCMNNETHAQQVLETSLRWFEFSCSWYCSSLLHPLLATMSMFGWLLRCTCLHVHKFQEYFSPHVQQNKHTLLGYFQNKEHWPESIIKIMTVHIIKSWQHQSNQKH